MAGSFKAAPCVGDVVEEVLICSVDDVSKYEVLKCCSDEVFKYCSGEVLKYPSKMSRFKFKIQNIFQVQFPFINKSQGSSFQ